MDIEYALLCAHILNVTVEFYRASNEMKKATPGEKEKKKKKKKERVNESLKYPKGMKRAFGV